MDGSFLLPFMEDGDDCHLVDYNDRPLPGIKKIANELYEIPPNNKYDVIICSQTLEHVVEPRTIVSRFYNLLKEDGLIYAEVPNEIFGDISARLGPDPVTHINFFTPKSFEILLRFTGFEITVSNPDKYGTIWCLATKSKTNNNFTIKKESIDIASFLNINRSLVIRKVFRRLISPG